MRRFTPETAFVRTIFVMNAKTPVSNGHPDVLWEERGAQFGRWLDEVRAEVWQEGWEDGRESVHNFQGKFDRNPYKESE